MACEIKSLKMGKVYIDKNRNTQIEENYNF